MFQGARGMVGGQSEWWDMKEGGDATVQREFQAIIMGVICLIKRASVLNVELAPAKNSSQILNG